MRKKIVNIFLILVLMVTVLPIKQVGNMLFNNQWTEELNEHSESSVEKKSQAAKWAFLTGADMLNSSNNSLLILECRFFAFSQRLPVSPSGEIHSPPPNFIPVV
ncbi:MAG: hypothetical protein V4717_08030 [Bacteroidota bacterium]